MNTVENFEIWMKNHAKQYTDSTRKQYIRALEQMPAKLNIDIKKPLLEITDVEELLQVFRPILNSSGYAEMNKKDHNVFSSAIEAYGSYLSSGFKFTWLPFYQELLDTIITKYNKETLCTAFKHIYSALSESTDYVLEEMDPFSFIFNFNRYGKEFKRLQFLYQIREEMGMKTGIKDVKGIPSGYSGFYWFQDQNDPKAQKEQIEKLWQIATSFSQNKFSMEDIQYILKITNIKLAKLSTVMFMCFPDKFFPLDKTTLNYAGQELKDNKSTEEFIHMQDVLKEQFPGEKPYQISYEAWEKSQNENIKLNQTENNDAGKQSGNKDGKFPINQVFFGPPGTGKTYNAVVKALEIIAQQDADLQKLIKEYNKKADDDKDKHEYYQKLLIPRFKELKRAGRIGFITFHQNYSYEDFVEGIRPKLDDASRDLVYECKPGIFKEIAEDALLAHLGFDNQTEPFEVALDKFKEMHPVDSQIHTKQSTFKIVKFLGKSIRIKPLEGKNVFSISYEPLKQAYLLNQQKQIKNTVELSEAIQGFQGLSSYYFAILEELNGIKIDDKKRILQSYYEGKRPLQEDCKPYVLIIDEINRGNISKIFGELITLLEEDKRIGTDKLSFDVELPYTREKFGVPDNLYIIGTMNTADKSIALVDVALRRRFVFEKMFPKANLITNTEVKDIFNALNKKIEDEDHKIGHSYFMNKTKDDMPALWEKQIMPLIKEYFYGDEEKIKEFYLPKIEENIGKTNDN